MNKTKLTLLPLVILLFSCSRKDNSIEAQAKIDSLSQEIQVLSNNQKQIEANKKVVADFYQKLFGEKDLNAIDKYIGDIYIQHNPSVADGKEAFRQAATKWLKGAAKEKIDIQHLSAEGNLVYIHTRSQRGSKTVSIIDIFKLENEKIIEHWDVDQEVPERSSNSHPMF